MTKPLARFWAAAAGLSIALMSCTHGGAGPNATSADASPATIARSQPGLHNVLLFDEDVISGSVPEGEEGFESLEAMGVRTIISVDGARPDVEAAGAHGMRYIHVPIRYNGMEEDARLSLARALREAEGPIYVHCHHGKHRGPAAAAYALVACDRITPEEGVELLVEAGTSPTYPGLFEVVADARPIGDREIAEAAASGHAPLVAVATVEGIVANMAAAGESWDHVKSIRDAGWRVPADHPDLVPAAEAGLLADIFRHLRQDDGFADEPADFRGWMVDAQRAAQDLEDAIVADDTTRAAAAMGRLGTACDSCHAVYRNE